VGRPDFRRASFAFCAVLPARAGDIEIVTTRFAIC